jgi:hypothetical protein
MISSLPTKTVKIPIGTIVGGFFILILAAVGQPGQIVNMLSKWDFEGLPIDQPPAGFTFGRTGSGRLGRWLVKDDKNAPSGAHVLAQLDSDSTSYRFPIAVAEELSFRDFRLFVRCKPMWGKVDQACGLVFRYRDENNYYVVRANALENNVRLYYVLNGKRQQFGDWNGPVSSGTWHELRVGAKGDQFEIYWNGKKVIEARDKTFREPGQIGVWTKADSLTYFDDLFAESIDSK